MTSGRMTRIDDAARACWVVCVSLQCSSSACASERVLRACGDMYTHMRKEDRFRAYILLSDIYVDIFARYHPSCCPVASTSVTLSPGQWGPRMPSARLSGTTGKPARSHRLPTSFVRSF